MQKLPQVKMKVCTLKKSVVFWGLKIRFSAAHVCRE